MAEISAKDVMALREETGAGPMDCKRALTESNGDIKKAKEWLEARSLNKAEKVTGRVANQGVIESYIHSGRIGALVELRCETDFVGRNDEFKKLAKEVAMHVTGIEGAEYAKVEDIPADVLEAKKAELGDGINKWYEETVLMSQPYVRDNKVTVGDLVTQAKAKLGENIYIQRFVRFELGK